MVAAITDALGTVISWCGEVISAVTATDGALTALLPLWAIGIGISALMLGIKVMRGFAWGN